MATQRESPRQRLSRAYVDAVEQGTRKPAHTGIAAAAFALLLFVIFLISGISMGDAQGAAIFGAAFTIYWLPTLIAWGRRVRNPGQVAIVNLFLGWTIIGWIIALVMAAGHTHRDRAGHA